MNHLKNILFVAQRAPSDLVILDQVLALAFENQADLTVAIPLPTPREWTPTAPAWMTQITGEVLASERQRLGPLLRPLRTLGIEPTYKVLTGESCVQILREVVTCQRDVVVIGSDTSGYYDSLTLGLFRLCPCPVWAIRPTNAERFARILVAVDATRTEPEIQHLHLTLIDLAVRLADQEEGRVDIVQAWEEPGAAQRLTSLARFSASELQSVRLATQEHFQNAFSDLIARASLRPEHQRHLRRGPPSEVVLQAAREFQSDLLMLGSLNTMGQAGFSMGHTADGILHRVTTSVFSAKPQGFLSPLTDSTPNL